MATRAPGIRPALLLACLAVLAPPTLGCRRETRAAEGQGQAPAPALLQPFLGRLPEALAKVDALAQARGLAGWPEAPGQDPKRADLVDRVFRNDRAFILRDADSQRLSALVLMAMQAQGPEGPAYRLVLVEDLLGSPALRSPLGPGSQGGGELVCFWEDGEREHARNPRDPATLPQPGLNLFLDEPLSFAVAAEGTDDFSDLLYAPGHGVVSLVRDLLDADGRPEHAGPEDEGYGFDLPRSDFARARKSAEDPRYVWFELDGKTYGAEKADWDLWTKAAPAPKAAP